jgi:signal recognition particle receptor subunit beta
MPVIDSATDSLVVKIVYDGPPMSGKTTTLRALADCLTTKGVETPAEANGRTLFFDWVEFVGGDFDGRKIRCQIVSVPGQPELRHRRQFLLSVADAVVFVADTRAGYFESGLEQLNDLVSHARSSAPPLGVVFQANKRDDPTAVDEAECRRVISELCPLPFIDTVAVGGSGVREAFVFAVRLCLDRARALAAEGRLERRTPLQNTSQELLDQMQTRERGIVGSVAPSFLGGYQSENLGELDFLAPERNTEPVTWVPGEERLFRPSDPLPSGHLWPPIDGRTLLYEASHANVSPIRTAAGDWWASTAGWRFHSSRSALYDDENTARNHFIGWARQHAQHSSLLSPGRALILADASDSTQRLWQLVRVEPSLRERLLQHDLFDMEVSALADEVCAIAEHLMVARQRIDESGLPLRCSLWTIDGTLTRAPRFVGLMPTPTGQVDPEPDGELLLTRELLPQLRLLSQRSDFHDIYGAFRARSQRPWATTLTRMAETLLDTPN